MKPGNHRGKAVRVLIVDDHHVVRVGLRALLESAPGVAVAGECGRGLEALELAAKLKPDVVLLDMRLPDLDGVEVCRRLKLDDPSPAVLFLTSYGDDRTILAAIGAGADGYLLKEATGQDIPALIRAAAAGGSVLDPLVAQRVMAAAAPGRGGGQPRGRDAGVDALTPQERRVLELVAEGRSNKQVAAQLDLGEGTVRNYLSSVFAKLGVESRVAAVTRWLEGR